MKTLASVTTRRDRCYLIGQRAARLSPAQAAEAWFFMARRIEELGDVDVPKFNTILTHFRRATIAGARPAP